MIKDKGELAVAVGLLMTAGEGDAWDSVRTVDFSNLKIDGGEPAGQSSDGLANSV